MRASSLLARAAASRASRTKRPSPSTSEGTRRGSASGAPSVRFRCRPAPSAEAPSSATRSLSIRRLTITVVLVTMPRAPASRIPRLTAVVRPKSSALTMRVRAALIGAPARRGARAGSRLAHHAAKVRPERLSELRPRSRDCLGILELVDVDRQGNALLLDPIELRGEAAALVGFREHDLRPREAPVVLRDALDHLGEQALDRLLLRPGHGRERCGQRDVGHGMIPVVIPVCASGPRRSRLGPEELERVQVAGPPAALVLDQE